MCTVQNIDKIDNDLTHWAKINCNYFEIVNKSIYGLYYGIEQSFTNDFAPKREDWLVAWLNKENKMYYDTEINTIYGRKMFNALPHLWQSYLVMERLILYLM